MATVYATVNGRVRTSTENQEITPAPGGVPTVAIAEYEASSLATASTIHFAYVPAYCAYRVRELNHDALGSGTAIEIGINGSTAQQLASVSTVSAGVAPANAGGWKQTDSGVSIIGTTTGTMTGTLQLVVEILKLGASLTL